MAHGGIWCLKHINDSSCAAVSWVSSLNYAPLITRSLGEETLGMKTVLTSLLWASIQSKAKSRIFCILFKIYIMLSGVFVQFLSDEIYGV